MKVNPMSAISKLFDNRKFLIVFSVVCAVVFWLVIDITENPSRDITMSDVTVKLMTQTDDSGNELAVIGEQTKTVSVTISGPGYIVGTITKDDITVSVSSYAKVTKPDTYVLPLTATVSKSGCTISRIYPSEIPVVYDYDTVSQVPVEYDVAGIQPYVAADCEIYKTILKSNSGNAEYTTLPVSGPSKVLGSVAKVVVRPIVPSSGVTGLSENYEPVLTFCNVAGEAIDASELEFDKDLYVRIVVYKTAEVKMVPSFTNLPECFANSESGLPPYKLSVYDENSKSSVSADKVQIKGPVDIVDGLVTTGVTLSPIDFLEVKPGSTSFNVSFVLSEGVEVVDGTEEVTVALELGSLTTKTIKVQPSAVKFDKLYPGFTAKTSYKNAITVVVCGTYGTLRNVTADDIKVSVDCEDITAVAIESKTLTADVVSGEQAWVNSIAPTEISVSVE